MFPFCVTQQNTLFVFLRPNEHAEFISFLIKHETKLNNWKFELFVYLGSCLLLLCLLLAICYFCWHITVTCGMVE